MKPYPPIPSFYHLIFLSLSFWNCNRPVPPPEVHGAGAVEKMWPQEWMYAQRAYPYPSINREAVRDAWRQAKEATTTGRTAAQWEPAGPVNVGGRITALVLHPADQNIIYVGTSAGGIFKTTNKGATWTAVFEEAGAMSVGALAMAPSDPEVLYMGAGEANGSATSGAFFGDGVYKTTDGGNTWTHIGLANTQHIGRIAIDPVNADRVYVAAAGVLYGKNDERGLYRTTDGGTNWEQVLFVSDSTACIDVVVNPVNASIVYAATWERIRYPWQRHYGGPTSRVYRSFDGGNSWEQLTNGLPPDSDQTGRIGLAIAPSNPAVLYACYTTDPVTNTFDGIYKSEDAGSSWTRVDQSDISFVFSSFGWFFGNLRVHPTESNDVSLLGVLLVRSTDGGATWADATFNMHVDFHALEFHPQNPFFVVAGNDGGVYISEDGGFNWQHAQGLPNNLIYNCEIDHLQPNHLYAGFQDQGTQRTLTGAVDDFERILGAD
ncbi:MAG TPA: hypothetical protein ENJ20_07565, partial [Bacteroidetes bacterium]|nr:hypothetical protein [Bacteroidota bacterium]